MKETGKRIGSERRQGELMTRLLRLLKADAGVHVSIVGQNETQQDSREEIRSVALNADRAKAIALMEWQKSRRVPQAF